MYADYIYYRSEFKGTIITDEETYNRLAIEADAIIDGMTHGNIDTSLPYMSKVKNAECAVCETCLSQNEKVKQSESVGNHSVTYAVNKHSFAYFEQIKASKVKLYLSGTGLFYGGLN